MKQLLSYLRYSGLWVGLVVNPCHWQWGIKGSPTAWEDYCFDNAVHVGPVWIRLIIDDGRW